MFRSSRQSASGETQRADPKSTCPEYLLPCFPGSFPRWASSSGLATATANSLASKHPALPPAPQVPCKWEPPVQECDHYALPQERASINPNRFKVQSRDADAEEPETEPCSDVPFTPTCGPPPSSAVLLALPLDEPVENEGPHAASNQFSWRFPPGNEPASMMGSQMPRIANGGKVAEIHHSELVCLKHESLEIAHKKQEVNWEDFDMMNTDISQEATPDETRMTSRCSVPEDGGNGLVDVHASYCQATGAGVTSMTPSNSGMPCDAWLLSSFTPKDLYTHGQGSTPMAVGFLGEGPFWTCGSTPQCRAARRRSNGYRPPVPVLQGRPSPTPGCAGMFPLGIPSIQITTPNGHIDLTAEIRSTIAGCMELLRGFPSDPPPSEEELTTVALETKEQRLVWRDFLSEAVSKSCARSLFASYDVEAEPPKYARPPLSLPSSTQRSSAVASSDVRAPHVVAPRGAGWSPLLGSSRRRHVAERDSRTQTGAVASPTWSSASSSFVGGSSPPPSLPCSNVLPLSSIPSCGRKAPSMLRADQAISNSRPPSVLPERQILPDTEGLKTYSS